MGLFGLAVEQIDPACGAYGAPASRGATGVASGRERAPAFSNALRTCRTTVAWSTLPAAATMRCLGS